MTLTPTRHKMPDYIQAALTERGRMDAYRARPDYQQNDYIGSLCVASRAPSWTQQSKNAWRKCWTSSKAATGT